MSKLPLKSKISFALAAIYLLGVLAILLGNGEIRAGYLKSEGQAPFALAFIAIQLGVAAAATAVSIEHAHPYARRWRQVVRRLLPAFEEREEKLSEHVHLVGRHNGLVDQRQALLAMAGKQVEISRSDVPRQQALARHWELLASPEAVEEKLFTKPPVEPTKLDDPELTGFLKGIVELPSFERKDTAAINERRKTLRDKLNQLREERRNLNRPSKPAEPAPPPTPEGTPTPVVFDDIEITVEKPPGAAIDGNGGTSGRADR